LYFDDPNILHPFGACMEEFALAGIIVWSIKESGRVDDGFEL
jgi:hypothetical protein